MFSSPVSGSSVAGSPLSGKPGEDTDPTYINRWGSINHVEWRKTKVEHSSSTGFSVTYRHNNPNWTPNRKAQVRSSWRNQLTPSSSRPNSGSSIGSFKSNSSQQSAVVLSNAEQAQKVLLRIPYDLVLCEDYLNDYAKLDPAFGTIIVWMMEMDLTSPKFPIIAFLCMAWIRKHPPGKASADFFNDLGVENPWFDYVDWLPTMPGGEVSEDSPAPLTNPTVWTVEEQKYLVGTSLENVIPSKMSNLSFTLAAFQEFAEATNEPQLRWVKWITLSLWTRFDACFLSRSLETPESGTCMIPCLDMVNHCFDPNSHYVQDGDNGDIILMKYDQLLSAGSEITINYAPKNGAAECLMVYGFIDANITFNDQLSIRIPRSNPSEWQDSWHKKLAIFRRCGYSEHLEIRQNSEGECSWECPFAYFLAVTEKHGLQLEKNPPEFSGIPIFDGGDESKDIPFFMASIATHQQKREIRLCAVTQIMGIVRLEINKVQSKPPIPESSYAAAMGDRLRQLELGSLLAVNRELIKESSALNRNSPSDSEDVYSTADDGVA